MSDRKEDKNRMLEVIIVKGIKYIKDVLNSRLYAAQIVLKGGNVNILSRQTLEVKAVSKFYI